LFRYRLCGMEERATLEAHAMRVACISSRPVYVLRELVDLLRQRRIVLPGYTFLQEVVRRALAFERRRLGNALGGLIGTEDTAALEQLLQDHDGLYAITAIKHQPRDFSHKQLLSEVERGEQIRPLFKLALRVIN
jgi:hypothetical protein